MYLDKEQLYAKFKRDNYAFWTLFRNSTASNNRIAINTTQDNLEQSWALLEAELNQYEAAIMIVATRSSPTSNKHNYIHVKWGETQVGSVTKPNQSATGDPMKGFQWMYATMVAPMVQQQQLLMQQLSENQLKMAEERGNARIEGIRTEFLLKEKEEQLEAARSAPIGNEFIGAFKEVFQTILPDGLPPSMFLPTAKPSTQIGVAGLKEATVTEPTETATEPQKKEMKFPPTGKISLDLLQWQHAQMQKIYPQYNMHKVWHRLIQIASSPLMKPTLDETLEKIMVDE